MKKTLGRLHLALFFVVAIVLLWIGYVVVYGHGGVFERREARRQVRALEMEITALESEKARVEGMVEFLQNNMRYIEGYARELGYKKKGEVIFKFIEKKEVKPDGG